MKLRLALLIAATMVLATSCQPSFPIKIDVISSTNIVFTNKKYLPKRCIFQISIRQGDRELWSAAPPRNGVKPCPSSIAYPDAIAGFEVTGSRGPLAPGQYSVFAEGPDGNAGKLFVVP